MSIFRFLGVSLVDAPLRFKCSIGGAMALEKGIDQTNAMINMGISSYLNHQSSKSLMKRAQKWQEDFYNKYQSPEAMYRQYKEAGLNPVLMSDTNGLGSGQTVNSPSSGPSGTSPLPPGASGVGADWAKVESFVGDQKADAFMKTAQGITQLLKEGNPQMAQAFLNQMLPTLKVSGFDQSNAQKFFDEYIRSYQLNNEVLEIESKWQKQFGFDLRSTQFMALERSIDLMVGQANVMQTEADLNRTQAVELGSRIGRNFAEAFKLEKEGNYYRANTETADQIRKYVIDNLIISNGNASREFQRLGVLLGNEEAAAEIKREMSKSRFVQYGMALMEGIGKVVHVGVGFNWSKLSGLPTGKTGISSPSNVVTSPINVYNSNNGYY